MKRLALIIPATLALLGCAHLGPAASAASCAAKSKSLAWLAEQDPVEMKAAAERIKVAASELTMPALEDVALVLAAAQASADLAECIDR